VNILIQLMHRHGGPRVFSSRHGAHRLRSIGSPSSGRT
jgi:hypothetical protein